MVLWRPEALQAATQASEELGDFAYVVVEELVDRLIVLIAWPWPEADDQGRLFWPMTKESDYKTAVTTRAASDLDRRLLSDAATQRRRLTTKRLKIAAPPSRANRS